MRVIFLRGVKQGMVVVKKARAQGYGQLLLQVEQTSFAPVVHHLVHQCCGGGEARWSTLALPFTDMEAGFGSRLHPAAPVIG